MCLYCSVLRLTWVGCAVSTISTTCVPTEQALLSDGLATALQLVVSSYAHSKAAKAPLR